MANIRVSSIPTTIASLYADTGTAVIVSSLSIESVVLIFGESASNSYAVSTPDCTHGALPES
ncbi:MAG: Mg2+/Co2+ transporter CorB [Natronomonas sp.]|jgi:Mg2+/Co2+ transporter CorB